MAQATPDATTSRRSFLSLLGRSAAVATVTTVPVAMATPAAFISPAAYIAECDAIGYRIAAFSLDGEPIGGFSEIGFADDADTDSARERLFALRQRMRKVDPLTWYDAVAAQLAAADRCVDLRD